MTDAVPKGQSIAGRVLSGLVILFLLFDAGLKLVSPETAIKYSPPDLGWPLDVPTMTMLGTLLLIPDPALYLAAHRDPRRDPDHRLSRRRGRHPCSDRQPVVQPHIVRPCTSA